MKNSEIRRYVKNKYTLLRISGKFAPILRKNEEIKITRIYLLNPKISSMKNICFFFTKSNLWLGVILSHQTSELLMKIAKKITRNQIHQKYSNQYELKEKLFSYFLVQYRFPNDLQSIKLILLISIRDISEILENLEFLSEIRILFKKSLEKIADFVT
ncbi:hypothetical protein [Candidatus Harpocratesius sp.]